MDRLLRFLAAYRNLFLFLLLEGAALVMLINFKTQHNLLYRDTALATAAWFNGHRTRVLDYFELRNSNAHLQQENLRLQQELLKAQAQLARTRLTLPRSHHYTLLSDSLRNAFGYSLIPAQVIHNSVDRQNNYLLLNRGSRQGLRAGMGIISSEGVVGQVVKVSPDAALAMSVLNRGFALSVRIRKPEVFGSLTWAGGNPTLAKVQYIPLHYSIQPGDTVVTSGLNTLFPEQFRVGRVTRVAPDEQGGFHDITLQLFADFRRLDVVYCVDHKGQPQLDTLSRGLAPAR